MGRKSLECDLRPIVTPTKGETMTIQEFAAGRKRKRIGSLRMPDGTKYAIEAERVPWNRSVRLLTSGGGFPRLEYGNETDFTIAVRCYLAAFPSDCRVRLSRDATNAAGDSVGTIGEQRYGYNPPHVEPFRVRADVVTGTGRS